MTKCMQCNKLIKKIKGESWAEHDRKTFCKWTCVRLWQFNHIKNLGPDWRKVVI